MTESIPLWQTRKAYRSTWKRFQNKCERSACFHGEFSLWCRNSKAFCKRPFTLQPWASEEVFSGKATRVFFQNFSKEMPKVVKFVFSHSKLRKQPFLLKFSKSRGKASLPTPMIATSTTWKR